MFEILNLTKILGAQVRHAFAKCCVATGGGAFLLGAARMMLLAQTPHDIQSTLKAAKLSDRLAAAITKHVVSIQKSLRSLEDADKDGTTAIPFRSEVEEGLAAIVGRPSQQQIKIKESLARLEELDNEATKFLKAAGKRGIPNPKEPRLAKMFAQRDASYRAVLKVSDYYSKLNALGQSALLTPELPKGLRVESHPRVNGKAISKLRHSEERRTKQYDTQRRQVEEKLSKLSAEARPLELERDRLRKKLNEVESQLARLDASRKSLELTSEALAAEAQEAQDEFEETLKAKITAVQTSRHTSKVSVNSPKK